MRTFLFGLWEAADPDRHGGSIPTALDLVERGATRLDSLGTGAGPEVRVEMFMTLGFLFGKLGEYDRAAGIFERAAREARQTLGTHELTGGALDGLAQNLINAGRVEEAEAPIRESIAVRKAASSPDTALAGSYSTLGVLLSTVSRYDEAREVHQAALELRRHVLGERHPATVAAMNNLATVRFRRGDYAWAADVQEQVVDAWRAGLGLSDDRTLAAIHNLGVMRLRAGDLAGAERYIAEALDARRRVLADRHPTVGQSLRWLSELRRVQGRFGEAESVGRNALAILEEAYPPRHPRIAEAVLCVGAALVEADRPAAAIGLLRSALAMRAQAYPEASLEIGEARVWLGTALARAGDEEAARTQLRAALHAYEAPDRSGEAPAVLAGQELARLR